MNSIWVLISKVNQVLCFGNVLNPRAELTVHTSVIQESATAPSNLNYLFLTSPFVRKSKV